jgi:hypothetical protein
VARVIHTSCGFRPLDRASAKHVRMGTRARLETDTRWRTIAADQFGMIAHHQLVGLGLTSSQARQWVRSHRWRRVLPGVYATFTGPLPERARLSAAVLFAGRGAVVTGFSALWLAEVLDAPPDQIQIAIPAERQVKSVPGLRITRSRALASHAPPRGSIPSVPLELAVLEACDLTRRAHAVLDVVFRACQRRKTTADRLLAELRARPRHRWRRLLQEILTEVRAGVASPLELRYRRDVEQAHGLPDATRNRPESGPGRPATYRDARHKKWRTVVELDGRGAHPDEEAFRDHRRDNLATIDGDSVLRFGWHDVVTRPCSCAVQVAHVLRQHGWTGTLQPCGPRCPIAAPDRSPGLSTSRSPSPLPGQQTSQNSRQRSGQAPSPQPGQGPSSRAGQVARPAKRSVSRPRSSKGPADSPRTRR